MHKRQIAISTATTGCSIAAGDRLVEIACVEMIDHKPSGDSLHCYLNPERASDEDALVAHGLPDEFLMDKPLFADIVADLLSYLAGAEVILHEADAHIEFLDMELGRMGHPGLVTWVAGLVDTLLLAEERFPGKCNSLDVLCGRLGIEMPTRSPWGSMIVAELVADVYAPLARK